MYEEYNALIRQCTWELVPCLSHKNIIGANGCVTSSTKWMVLLSRLKARFVAKSFHQQEGLNYSGPSYHLYTLWIVRQLVVSNAFLYGFVHEDIYGAVYRCCAFHQSSPRVQAQEWPL